MQATPTSFWIALTIWRRRYGLFSQLWPRGLSRQLVHGDIGSLLTPFCHTGQVDLIKYCVEKNLKFISCMGAGAKADVSSIRYCDVSEAEGVSVDRLLRTLVHSNILTTIPFVVNSPKKENTEGSQPSYYSNIHVLQPRPGWLMESWSMVTYALLI